MRVFAAIGAGVLALALAGCAYFYALGANGASPTDGPGTPTGTYAPVSYYPACGNEILIYEGTTWYPFVPDGDWEVPIFDGPSQAPTADASGASGGHGGAGLAMARVPVVASPGPGDDVGTLLTYEGGLGYWQSDSGTVKTWLTTEPQTYNWVC